MNRHFKSDSFPGRPRILFIGFPENSHTHAWIDLLQGSTFNVRLFSMPTGIPPNDWPVRSYVTAYYCPQLNPETRARLYPMNSALRFTKRLTGRARGLAAVHDVAGNWLAKVIQHWRPDVVHTFGVEQSADFYFSVRRKFGLERIGRWVLQTRGGSDLVLPHLDPERRQQLAEMLSQCDQLICDNEEDLRIARELGLRPEQRAPIAPVPGTGGIDVESLSQKWQGLPASRRVIVWPKAYESALGKMLPALEALKLCWDQIQPCEVHMLSMFPNDFRWYRSLPEHIRQFCHASAKVPRDRVLELMSQARVMLAPSLIEGVPNSMYEAMASGAFPIVSPLDTIRPLVEDGRNVLFARNLYPQEIAAALTRAMTDDELVDSAAEHNLSLVRQLADRSVIRPLVIEFYERLAAQAT